MEEKQQHWECLFPGGIHASIANITQVCFWGEHTLTFLQVPLQDHCISVKLYEHKHPLVWVIRVREKKDETTPSRLNLNQRR